MCSKSEHIINTDDSRRIELQECCTSEKCYSKPPFLQKSNCTANHDISSSLLEKSYEQTLSKDHYNMLLQNLKIRPIDNTVIERVKKEININIKKIDDISNKIGSEIYNKIILDNTDNVSGYASGYDIKYAYADYKPRK